MKNQKIQHLYNLLSESEKSYFQKWLKIEISNGKLEVLLPDYCREFLEQKKEKSEIWQELFPGEKYEQETIYKLTNKLQIKLEEYLSLISFRKSPIPNRNLHLLRLLVRRGNQEIFDKMKLKVSNQLSKEAESIEKYRWLYELEVLKQEVDLKYSANIQERKEENLIHRFENWTNLEKLFLVQVNQNLRKALNQDFFYKQAFSKEPYREGDGLLFQILLQLNKLLEEEMELSDAFRFFDRVKDNMHLLSPKMQAYVFGIISNYLVRKSNKNKNQLVLNYLWEWYDWGVEQKMLKFKGEMLTNHLKNMMVLANLLGSLEKIEKIRKNIVDRLPLEIQSETLWIAKVLYEQAIGNFDAILKDSPPKIFRNLHFELNWRAIELQAIYEDYLTTESFGSLDWLEQQLKNFKAYLKRHESRISRTHHEAYMNFCTILHQMSRVPFLKMEKEVADRFYEKINENQVLYGKTWLFSKIQQK